MPSPEQVPQQFSREQQVGAETTTEVSNRFLYNLKRAAYAGFASFLLFYGVNTLLESSKIDDNYKLILGALGVVQIGIGAKVAVDLAVEGSRPRPINIKRD